MEFKKNSRALIITAVADGIARIDGKRIKEKLKEMRIKSSSLHSHKLLDTDTVTDEKQQILIADCVCDRISR